MKKLLLIFTLCALVGCGETNDNGNNSGDWYNGGINGDYEEFSFEWDAPEDWEAVVIRYNAAIEDWFTFSPTKGKAGKNKITFRVPKENILDGAQIYFGDDEFYISDEENYYLPCATIAGDEGLNLYGKSITAIDISKLKKCESFEIGCVNATTFKIGECPVLEYLALTVNVPSIVFPSFPKLRLLDIIDTPTLKSIDASACSSLKRIDITGSNILEEIWLKQGQNVDIRGNGNWTVKYK